MKKVLALLVFAPLGALAAEPEVPRTSALLEWTAPTTYTDGTPLTSALTYHVYRGVQGQPKTRAQSSLTSRTFTFTNLPVNTTQCFVVTAVADGMESAPSAEGCKSIVPGTPSATTLTVR